MSHNIENLIEESEGKKAVEILEWGLEKFHPNIAFASSFGAEDIVVIDMLCKINPDAKIFTLDTGRLHEETYNIIESIRNKYNIELISYCPQTELVEKLEREKGFYSFRNSLKERKECCYIRKIEPLNRAMAGLKAWITGVRREQVVTRKDIKKVEIDIDHNSIVKINPIADWSESDVWDYIRDNSLAYNQLHDKGFPSIGCAPCTRAIKKTENVRAGRWWWEDEKSKECGLHSHNH